MGCGTDNRHPAEVNRTSTGVLQITNDASASPRPSGYWGDGVADVPLWRVGDGAENRRYVRIADMKKDDVKAVLGRVLSWPPDEQEKVARFVREVEQRRAGDDIGEEEWEIIEARAARRDLATDKEVEQVFSRYRGA